MARAARIVSQGQVPVTAGAAARAGSRGSDWPARPIPQCYWVAPGQLLVGQYPGDMDPSVARGKVSALLDAGVDVFVDLMAERDRVARYEGVLEEEAVRRAKSVRHVSYPFRDLSVPEPALLVEVLDAIDSAISGGRVVYAHCFGGIGRTGVLVGAWLVRHGYTAVEALTFIRDGLSGTPRSYRESPETEEQRQFVRDWPEGSTNVL